jgi:hypothetical protein
MTIRAQQVFVNRVQVALGWSLLIGLTATINMIPRLQHSGKPIAEPARAQQTVVLHHAMVVPQQADRLPANQRVAAWFGQFDQIRTRAQMTGPEKMTAIKLWATSMVQPSSSDTQEGQQLLMSMVQRYDRAIKELSTLRPIPETRNLQKGYMTFFKQAHTNFQQYVKAFQEKSTKEAIDQMAVGRQQLAEIDARNKTLDRKLRKQYGIPEID